MDTTDLIRIGTCSWKYDSWKGLVYSGEHGRNYLEEYSRRYSTVEVDQWFWSLFKSDTPLLPRAEVVRKYVKNHYEGSSPRTIGKIKALLIV